MKLETVIKILFGGDLFPGGEVATSFMQDRAISLMYDFSDVMNAADLRIINLECPLTSSEKRITKTGPHLKAPPEMALFLKGLRIDLVTLANNHILDYGEAGLSDTIENCRKAGIRTVGAGSSIDEAKEPCRIQVGEHSISVINFCESEFSIAGHGTAGASPFDFYQAARQIRKGKEAGSTVFVVYHGGNEHYDLPSPRLRETFRFMADMGADAVIGHHTHCFSGIETYSGKPLVYSLGNFLFDERTDFDPWYTGFVITFEIDASGIRDYQVTPFEQCRTSPGLKLLNPEQKKEFDLRFDRLSRIIRDDELLVREWNDYSAKMAYHYSMMLNPPGKLEMLALKIMKKAFGKRFLRKASLRQFNIIRNEAHRDLLLTVLKNNNKQ